MNQLETRNGTVQEIVGVPRLSCATHEPIDSCEFASRNGLILGRFIGPQAGATVQASRNRKGLSIGTLLL